MSKDGFEVLRQQIQQLTKELADSRQKIAELERARNGAAPDMGELPIAISEFEETLRRLVQRTAMIVQAEKCVIMVRDRETGELIARAPAFGMTDEEIKQFRVSPDKGVSGAVFQSNASGIFHDSATDERAIAENMTTFRIHNGVTVPLLIERRDEENHIVDRITIGVLHCFNKRYGGEFIEEDVRLLERLSRSAAAVIANAQMFQEVVEEKQKLAHTLESLTAGLIFVNQHDRIGQINTQARAMFVVPAGSDPIGKPLAEVVRHEECLKLLEHKLTELRNPPLPVPDDDEAKQSDEITVHDQEDIEYIYQVHTTGVTGDNGEPIGTVFLFTDITDLRHVERMKTEFVSIVSHELRTPLTPMKGFVRTLLDDENEEWYTHDDRREFYKIIEENVDRLGRLIDDLLNVSRIEKMGAAGLDMKWEEVDLRKAVEDVVMVQRGRTDKHTLVVDFEPGSILAETDPDKIQNILHNLISNAIKYSERGEIRIIGRLEPATEEQPESVLLGVKDQGIGMTQADLKKVGEKFFRTSHSKGMDKGTGIGLYLVIKLLEAHRGVLWPESEGIGKGSTFWFRFPVRQPRDGEGNILPLDTAVVTAE